MHGPRMENHQHAAKQLQVLQVQVFAVGPGKVSDFQKFGEIEGTLKRVVEARCCGGKFL